MYIMSCYTDCTDNKVLAMAISSGQLRLMVHPPATGLQYLLYESTQFYNFLSNFDRGHG